MSDDGPKNTDGKVYQVQDKENTMPRNEKNWWKEVHQYL